MTLAEAIEKYLPSLSAACSVWAAALAAALAVASAAACRRGKLTPARAAAGSLLIEYIFLVLSATVLTREPAADYRWRPFLFWSYRAIAEGKGELVWECLFNVAMLVPVGVLLPAVKKHHGGRSAVVTAFLFSAAIELTQLVTKRGWFELDDIFHNTCGAALGVALYRLGSRWVRQLRRRGTDAAA